MKSTDEKEESTSKSPPENKETYLPSNISTDNLIKENDYIFLQFNDGKRMFTQATTTPKNNKIPLKINKRSYSTSALIGLQYGTVIEIQHSKMVPLDSKEDLNPDMKNSLLGLNNDDDDNEMEIDVRTDNRDLMDNNTAQTISCQTVEELKQDTSKTGQDIIHTLIQNSTTYSSKTNYANTKLHKHTKG